jgi:tetratricopeptide (TPR) repeat protein
MRRLERSSGHPCRLLIAALPLFAITAAGQGNLLPQTGPSSGPVAAAVAQVVPANSGSSSSAQAQTATQSPAQVSPEDQGDSLEAQKRYQAAIAAYSKVPHPSAEVWNKMGIAYQMLFNLKDAQRCYKESIKQNPKNATTVNNLGTIYDSLKQYGQAEKMYRKALKIAPNSAVIYKNLGTNLMTQHKYEKGMQAYDAAMRLEPGIFQDTNSPRVANPTNVQERGAMNYYMALGCVRSGQTDCALQYLRVALNEGYITAKKLAADDQFLSLRDNPGFQQLLADQQQQKPQQQ